QAAQAHALRNVAFDDLVGVRAESATYGSEPTADGAAGADIALRDAGLRHRKGREHLEAGGLCRGAARRVSHLHREAELTGLRALARHDAIARERQARGQLAAADGPRVRRGPTVSAEGDCLIHDPNLTVVEGKAGDREGGTSR